MVMSFSPLCVDYLQLIAVLLFCVDFQKFCYGTDLAIDVTQPEQSICTYNLYKQNEKIKKV